MTAIGFDTFTLLAKALGIGLLLAVPVGPIGLLCLRRSLTMGMAAGMAVGLGAATADGVYAGIAAFALGAAAPFIADTAWLGAAGGIADHQEVTGRAARPPLQHFGAQLLRLVRRGLEVIDFDVG